MSRIQLPPVADLPPQTKVAVLMGGLSSEREVSLMSGQGVLNALQSQGIDAHAFDPARQSWSELRHLGFNRAFIALHGRHGEDGTVQGALELLGIPYTGSGVLASALAMDKVMTKRMWQSASLSTPASVHLAPEQQTVQRIEQIIPTLGLPLIVKPPHEGSSIGVTKVETPEQLQAAIDVAVKLDPMLMAEAFIDGDEVTCPVLGQGVQAVALPVVRIAAPNGDYDYQNKYFTDDVKYHCPSGLSAPLEAQIQQLVLSAYRELGCRGWGRADLMIRRSDNRPFLLEMNTAPGMTSHSLVPMSARTAGISYEALCLWLLQSASLDRSAA
jgi:D-alanine-D-alanine ligase